MTNPQPTNTDPQSSDPHHVAQETDHLEWSILELFYRSQNTFREQFDSYEKRVLDHSYQKGLNRSDLRLSPTDLADLLDLKAIESMRNDFLFQLKDLCHVQFRGKDRTDSLDRYVSDIFHEISILKEEHYNVRTYAPGWEREHATEELSYILDEAHSMFPKKLNHVRFLMKKAQDRMEELLPTFTDNRIVVRSLYLHRDDFVDECYEKGIRDFYGFMYPELGAVEGYFEAGKSFFASGFYELAQEAFDRSCKEQEDSARKNRGSSKKSRRLTTLGRDLKERLELIEAAAKSPNGDAQLALDRAAGLLPESSPS